MYLYSPTHNVSRFFVGFSEFLGFFVKKCVIGSERKRTEDRIQKTEDRRQKSEGIFYHFIFTFHLKFIHIFPKNIAFPLFF